MDMQKFENVQCVWKPPGRKGENFSLFSQLIENKYKTKIDDYWDLHKWSIENVAEFWAELWDRIGIKYSKNYSKVIDLSLPLSSAPQWFVGAELNLSENLLRYRDDHVAMIAVGEDREKRVVTYAQVYKEVQLYAAALRKCGLRKGDRVVCYMSNREEAVFAMLAAVSIGGLWLGALPMLGAQAVLDRIKQVEPTFLITVDRFCFNGQETDMFPKLKVIAEGLRTLEKIIIVPTKPKSMKKDISFIPKSCFLDEFLSSGCKEDGSVPDIVFEQVSLSHPVLINFTSGSTGASKALIHDSGCLLTAGRDQWFNWSSERVGISLSVSPAGWASWTAVPLTFRSGRSVVLFDGEPYFLTPTYFWDLIDEHKITSVLVTPGILDTLEKRGFVPTEKHKLTSLMFVGAMASVVKPQNFDFVYKKVNPNVIFASVYGCSEVMGGCLVFHPSLPIYRGELSCPSLAVDVQCLNDAGERVVGEAGDLVIANPVPSLARGLWGDDDASAFRDLYFSKFADKFSLGDLAVVNPITKGFIILCRSDEVLKPHGNRFGSVEIYNVVHKLPEVADSVCVSQYSRGGTERAALFLKLREGHKLDDELGQKVRDSIEEELTDEYIPGLIMEVADIPYNMNGKKMEILIKKIINNMPYSTDVVRNKGSLEYFANVPPFEED